MKNNLKAKIWKPKPNQKEEITIIPKDKHHLLHDYFITNHKTNNKNFNQLAQENIIQTWK